MAAWAGFSDEDLRKLKQNDTNSGNDSMQSKSGKTMGRGRGHRGGNARGAQRGRVKQSPSRNLGGQHFYIGTPQDHENGPSVPLSPDQMLASPKQKVEKQPEHFQVTPNESSSGISTTSGQADGIKLKVKEDHSSSLKKTDIVFEEPKVEAMGKELDEKEYISREMTNLEKFQQQQKVIEEQNKRKKEILASAIVQRQKKAKAESTKLGRIQKELAQLDEMLHIDVSKVRDKIEEASREFMDAQKRYDRAEQEFVEAKMDLYRKQELKEQLTEHLCTIIHQNEVRKAKKLVELMEKLDMEEEGSSEIQMPELPQLALFNPVQVPMRSATSPPVLKSPNAGTPVLSSKTDNTKEQNGSTTEASEGNAKQGEFGISQDTNTAASGQSSSDSQDVNKDENNSVLSGAHAGLDTQAGENISVDQEPKISADNDSTDQNRNVMDKTKENNIKEEEKSECITDVR